MPREKISVCLGKVSKGNWRTKENQISVARIT